jgi:hypothetical protein
VVRSAYVGWKPQSRRLWGRFFRWQNSYPAVGLDSKPKAGIPMACPTSANLFLTVHCYNSLVDI